MKRFTLAITLIITIAISSQAQNIGISFTRGASGIYPNHYQFERTHSQGLSMGFHHAAKLKYRLHLQTGINVSALASTRSITTRSRQTVAVPSYFYYVDVPFLLEKKVVVIDKASTTPYLTLIGGVNAAFLWHDKGNAEAPDVLNRSNPVNPGITAAAMWSIPQSKTSVFSVGPQVKFLGTGGNFSKAAGYYALRIDWRFHY